MFSVECSMFILSFTPYDPSALGGSASLELHRYATYHRALPLGEWGLVRLRACLVGAVKVRFRHTLSGL